MLFLLIFANLLFSQPPCPGCEELFNAYETGLVAGLMDETVNVYMYAVYNGERLPVGNATLFMEVYNSTGDLYSRCRIFTDEKGKAVFSISEYKDVCSGQGLLRGCRIGIKFCCSSSPNCLLQPCLNESITSFEDVPPCGNIKPTSWPDSAYINDDGTPVFAPLFPTYGEVVYIPTLLPPLFEGAAPAICLPLFIIAGMLLVAAYATGGTPFFWFDLNALRFTTGERARVTGKGGFTLQQSRIPGAAKSAGELMKKVPVVKNVVEKVEEGVSTVGRKVAEIRGAAAGLVGNVVGGGVRMVTKILPGKPAPILKRMARVEEKLKGIGRGLRTGHEVRPTTGGEVRAGAERIAIGTGQFGGEEILSALLMAGFAKGNVASLAVFFGVPEAIISSVKAGAAKEQLEYLEKNSETLRAVLAGEAVPVKDAEAIYSNLSGACMAFASEFPEGDPRREAYFNLGNSFALLSEIARDSELLKTQEGKEFFATLAQETGQAFFVIRSFDPKILESAEKARKELSTGQFQPETPEYQALQATITQAQPYYDALSTLQQIANLSIAWVGNIQVGDKIISMGLNEKELREAREEIISLYGKPWQELMPQTEVERSLYNASITEWKGKLPNEKQFEEWKERQIELYGRAAEKAKEIADLLEKGASQNEIKQALEGEDIKTIKTIWHAIGNRTDPTVAGLLDTQALVMAKGDKKAMEQTNEYYIESFVSLSFNPELKLNAPEFDDAFDYLKTGAFNFNKYQYNEGKFKRDIVVGYYSITQL